MCVFTKMFQCGHFVKETIYSVKENVSRIRLQIKQEGPEGPGSLT